MKPSTIVNPGALFDDAGRRKLANLVVWGKRGLTRHQIENRLQKVLARIARQLQSKAEREAA